MSYIITPATEQQLMNIEDLDGLGNRAKLRKHRRRSHHLMGTWKKKYDVKKAELEELIQKGKDRAEVVSGLSKQLQIAGYSFDQIKAIAGK